MSVLAEVSAGLTVETVVRTAARAHRKSLVIRLRFMTAATAGSLEVSANGLYLERYA